MIALLRTELIKAVRRTRTLVILAALIGLPIVISLAVNARSDRRPDRGEGLFRLASQSGLVVPAAILMMTSAFLLVIIAGTVVGDAVAGDAATGNLRYLLLRPVSRTRLLIAKAAVSTLLVWVATAVVALTGLVAGVVLFGWHGISVPFSVSGGGVGAGFDLTAGQLLARVAFGTAYVAFGFTALVAIGTFFSTLTDGASGAIAATVGVYIVSEILDAITDLGSLRYGLPTHYRTAWVDSITANSFSGDLTAGVIVQVVYAAVFFAAAIVWFRRKDIRS